MKLRQIISVTLLIAYSLVLLHNTIPHQHDDESCPNMHQIHGHQHADHTHAEHSDWMTSMLHWLEGFDHAGLCVGHFDNFLTVITENTLKLPVSKLCVAVYAQGIGEETQLAERSSYPIKNPIPPPDLIKDQFKTSVDPSRGPPFFS
jgi:hypothetical protein